MAMSKAEKERARKTPRVIHVTVNKSSRGKVGRLKLRPHKKGKSSA